MHRSSTRDQTIYRVLGGPTSKTKVQKGEIDTARTDLKREEVKLLLHVGWPCHDELLWLRFLEITTPMDTLGRLLTWWSL